jgi:GcrA cell cycle regulator
MAEKAWFPERDDRLRQLWDAGLSETQIGLDLHCSKNSVAGRRHRLKLPARPSPIKNRAAYPQTRKSPAPPKVRVRRPGGEIEETNAPERPATVEPTLPQLACLAGDALPALPAAATCGACQWPIGEPKEADFRFCDGPALEGKPYCEEHCELAYVRKAV